MSGTPIKSKGAIISLVAVAASVFFSDDIANFKNSYIGGLLPQTSNLPTQAASTNSGAGQFSNETLNPRSGVVIGKNYDPCEDSSLLARCNGRSLWDVPPRQPQ